MWESLLTKIAYHPLERYTGIHERMIMDEWPSKSKNI